MCADGHRMSYVAAPGAGKAPAPYRPPGKRPSPMSRVDVFVATAAVTLLAIGWLTFVLWFSLPAGCTGTDPAALAQVARERGLPTLTLAAGAVAVVVSTLVLAARATTGRWLRRWTLLALLVAAPMPIMLWYSVTHPAFWYSVAFCF